METEFLVRQPKNLQTMAIVGIGDWIALQTDKLLSPISMCHMYEVYQHDATKAEELLSLQIESIRNVLYCNVLRKFHDAVAMEAIRALSNLMSSKRNNLEPIVEWKMVVNDNDEWSLFETPTQSNVIGRMIETLFTENLTYLTLRSDAMKTFGDAFYSKASNLTKLTHLDLQLEYYPNCDEITEANVIQAVKELHNLKSFSVNYCTENILWCLARNCKLIAELKLVDSFNIDDKHIKILSLLRNLRRVYLDETQVTQNGIEALLLSCRNVEYIFIAFEVVLFALYQILKKQYTGTQLKLQYIDYDVNDETERYHTTSEQLIIIIKTCPQIRKMKLFKDMDPIPHDYIMALNKLPNLRKLELNDYNFYQDKINKMFEVRGFSLVELCLERVEHIDLNALTCINQTCPNLTKLSLASCAYHKETPIIDGLCYWKREVSHPTFRHLETLILLDDEEYEDDDLNEDYRPGDEQLLFLLSNCPNIVFINLLFSLTDEIWLKVLNRNPLNYLKKLKIKDNKLSKTMLDRIIRDCINPPEVTFDYKHDDSMMVDSD